MSPTPQLLGLSASLSLLLSRYAPQYSFGVFFTGTLLFFAQFTAYVLWSVALYPRFFSPLRHVPTAPGGNLFIGQARRILSEPSGNPSQDWIDNIPNDGLIRYAMWSSERLLLTNPTTLSEVLVTKVSRHDKGESLVASTDGKLLNCRTTTLSSRNSSVTDSDGSWASVSCWQRVMSISCSVKTSCQLLLTGTSETYILVSGKSRLSSTTACPKHLRP